MIILSMDTEHFHFEAAGETEAQAKKAMICALGFHGSQYGLPEEEWWAGDYEIQRREILPGECFRDGQLLYREPKK